MKKIHVTTAQAAVLTEVLKKIETARKRSAVIMAALDIDSHDLEKCRAILNQLSGGK